MKQIYIAMSIAFVLAISSCDGSDNKNGKNISSASTNSTSTTADIGNTLTLGEIVTQLHAHGKSSSTLLEHYNALLKNTETIDDYPYLPVIMEMAFDCSDSLPKVQYVKSLLSLGANVNGRTGILYEGEATALSIAAGHGHLGICRILLQHGAEVNCEGTDVWRPLIAATQMGHIKTCKLLLEHGADANAKDHHLTPALVVAAAKGYKDICKLLLDYGANINAQERDGQRESYEARCTLSSQNIVHYEECRLESALHKATKKGDIDICRLLVERGADVNAKNLHGDMPLFMAVDARNLEISRLLLEHGAEVNALYSCFTPLYTALDRGDIEICKLLFEHGADINKKCINWTPLKWAISSCTHRERGKEVENEKVLKCVEWLITAGADVNACTDGTTALWIAVKRNNAKCVRMLISAGADVNTWAYGKTLLALAISEGKREIANMLFAAGAHE